MSSEEPEYRVDRDAISTLPEDILRLICNHLHQATIGTQKNIYVPYSAILLSHVSRTFRSVILGDVRMWSRVSNTIRHRSLIQTIVERSKEGNMEIHLRCRSRLWNIAAIPCAEFLESILPHASRCNTLTIFVPNRRYLRRDDYYAIQNSTKNILLPRLESLSLTYAGFTAGRFYDTAVALGFTKLCLTWSMPNLQSLQLDNIVHAPFPSRISSYSVVFRPVHEGPPWDFRPFVEFLAETPSLQRLKIATTRYKNGIESADDSDREVFEREGCRLPPTTLSNITVLALSIRDSDLTAMRIIFTALRLPNVTSLMIYIQHPDLAHEAPDGLVPFELHEVLLPRSRALSYAFQLGH